MNKTFILKNDLAEIKRLTDMLCKLCEENNIGNRILCDVSLALEEIFANIVHWESGSKAKFPLTSTW